MRVILQRNNHVRKYKFIMFLYNQKGLSGDSP